MTSKATLGPWSMIPVSALLFLFCVTGAAGASPVTFFGEDLNNIGTVRIPHPNSDAARTAFFGNLTGVGTETFEGFPTGTGTPLGAVFAGAGTATIAGTGTVQTQAGTTTNGVGRYPISGNNFWSAATAGNDFVINFSAPIAAFGFYGVDIGDFGGQLTLTLTRLGGGTTVLTVPGTVGNNASNDGSILYFGFFDTTVQYTSIAFNNLSTADVFAFDDMSVGSFQQVTPTVPEPATMLLTGLGLSWIAYRRRGSAISKANRG